MEGATFRFIGIVFSTIKDNGRNGITVIGNGTPFGRLSSYAAVSNITNNANIGISVTGAGFWVTGNTLDNNHTALHQANNSDFFVAYANNIVNHTLATLSYSGSGQRLIGHNWWGNYNVILDGLTNEEWSHRLGAPVIAWVDAYGNANLLNGHGPGPDYENPPLSEASLVSTTSSDIPVIISHGRNPDSAPFGNHITPDSENLCSDYYDFFVIDSNTTSGWTLTLPIDDDPDCINDVLNPKNLLRITDVSQCATPPAPTCWSFVPDNTITISGQKLVIANLTTAQLGGTPFVAGPKLAPTNTTLTTISAQTNSATSVYWFFAFVLLCLVSAGAMNRRF
jgi:hypothetical protein